MTVIWKCSHLDWWFARDVGDEEVHGDILTIDLIVHELFNVSRLGVCVHIAVILQYRNTKMCGLSLNDLHDSQSHLWVPHLRNVTVVTKQY